MSTFPAAPPAAPISAEAAEASVAAPAVAAVRARIPAGFVPKLGLVLGSGKSSARVLAQTA